MDDREWAISTCGEYIAALTEYDQSIIINVVLPYLSDDMYYDAFSTYLELLDEDFLDYFLSDSGDLYL